MLGVSIALFDTLSLGSSNIGLSAAYGLLKVVFTYRSNVIARLILDEYADICSISEY